MAAGPLTGFRVAESLRRRRLRLLPENSYGRPGDEAPLEALCRFRGSRSGRSARPEIRRTGVRPRSKAANGYPDRKSGEGARLGYQDPRLDDRRDETKNVVQAEGYSQQGRLPGRLNKFR